MIPRDIHGDPNRKARTMTRSTLIPLAAVAALAGALLVPAPAQAASFAGDLDTTFGGQHSGPGTCNVVSNHAGPQDVPVVENAAAAGATSSTAHTSTNAGDGTDTVTGATKVTGKVKATSAAGNPKAIDFTATGSVSLNASKPVHACNVQFYDGVDLDSTIVVTKAGWLDLAWSTTRRTRIEIYVERDLVDDPYVDMYALDHKHSGSGRTFVDPGVYEVFMEVEAVVQGTTDVPVTPVAASLHVDYKPLGAQTAVLKGKAKPFVKAPKAWACSSKTIDVKVTKNQKKASAVEQITFLVSGKKAGKVKTPEPGAKVKVKAALDADAPVTVVVELTNGKTLTATTSYAACTT